MISIRGESAQWALVRALSNIDRQRGVTMQRLSTGKRINTGADDPAGLIAVQMFNHEIAGVDAGLSNAQRADAMMDVAGGALTEISSLVTTISGLVVQSANTAGISDAERAANQLEIDSAIDAIDRIVQSTTFNGRRLLDGTQAIQTSLTAADAAKLHDVQVHGMPSGASGTQALTVEVVTAATKASTDASGWVDMSGDNTTLSADTSVTISGELGTTTVTITSGSDRADVIDAINDATSLTGVVATASGATGVALSSQNYGTDATVSVDVLSGDADFVSGGDVSTITGTDAVVTVNGSNAGVDGTRVSWTGAGYSMSFTLADNTTGTRTINVTGGGATFQLGSSVSSKTTIGISSLHSSVLGQSGLGYLYELKSGGAKDLQTDVAGAAAVIEKVSSQVALAAGRIGGFQSNAIEPTINSLEDAKEGLSSARSAIEDADMAEEMANMNRLDLLYQTTLSMISLTNNQRSTILSLFSSS
jgi:flagellin